MDNHEISDFELSQLIEGRLAQLQRDQYANKATESAQKFTSDDLTPGLLDHGVIINEILIKAALSGFVIPKELFSNSLAESVEYSILTQILLNFDVIRDGEDSKWCLNLNTRETIINSLLKTEILQIELNKLLPETDATGLILRKLLKQDFHLDLDSILQSSSEALPLLQALEWLQNINVPKPDIEDIRARWRSLQLLPDQEVLLQNGFVGRVAELKEVRRFVYENNLGNYSPFDSFIINGVGGAGKSSLIAMLCQEILQSKSALLAVLDFDKPGMNPSDSSWLEAEITRQIMNEFPQTYRNLNHLRKELRNLEQSNFPLHQLISGLKNELKLKSLDHLPLVLILDTYEEVNQRYLNPTIKEWLEDIAGYLEPIQLKIIFSGRFAKNPHHELGLQSNVKLLPVDEFDKPVTRLFLKRQGLNQDLVNEIADSKIFPKRPLELKLLAQLFKSDDSVTVIGLESELKDQNSSELFAGIIYRRVLLRIKNPLIRKMAHPGLILRFLTAELIRQVVGPVLDLNISVEQSHRIIDDLASYAWLAHRTKDNEVWHRRDLRRSMLKLMIAKDPEAAARIHINAIIYYSDDTFGHSDAIELLYHKMMLWTSEPIDDISEKECKMAWSALQPDLDDLPVTAKVLFKYLARKTINRHDIKHLPEKYQSQAMRMVGLQFAAKGLFGAALKTMFGHLDDMESWFEPDYQPRFYSEDREYQPWEMAVLINTANWQYLSSDMPIKYRPASLKYVVDMLFIKTVIFSSHQENTDNLQDGVLSFTRKTSFLGLSSGRGMIMKKIIASAASLIVERRTMPYFLPKLADLFKNILYSPRNKLPLDYQKQMFLLDLLTEEGNEHSFMIYPNMLSLDYNWLSRFAENIADYHSSTVINFREALQELHNKPVKSILRSLNSYDNPNEQSYLDFSAIISERNKRYFIDILVGSYPEFRNPIKYAIISVMQETNNWQFLFQTFREVIKMPVNELHYEYTIEKWIEKPELAIDPYIELIDLFWKLPELLYKMCLQFEGHPKLESVRKAFMEQDEKMRHLISLRLS